MTNIFSGKNSKPILEVEHMSKTYVSSQGEGMEVLQDINFSAHEGEFISLVGPSGCGKSTLIRLLAGLVEPSQGKILVRGEKVHSGLTDRGVMFQDYSLFPWLNVEENIGYGLSMLKVNDGQRRKVVEHYVSVMGLKGFEHSYPKALSGGMQQRVALARTLAINPKILLLDEPFGALDVQTKRFMGDLLLQIWTFEPRTVVFVTHDVEEAVFLSDTVYIMGVRPGTLREKVVVDLPRPRTLDTEYSAKFGQIAKHIQEVITKESLGLIKLDLEIYKNLE